MRRLINQQPGRAGALMLTALPLILVIAAYLYYSNARLAENPGDKLLPSPVTIAATIRQFALEEDERSGEYLLWNDTRASLERLSTALPISALMGVTLGVAMRVLPYLGPTLGPFVPALALIPPLATL